MGVLGEALTQVLIPLAAVVGICFALLQWLLVSRIKFSIDHSSSPGNGHGDVEEEEEGVDGVTTVAKCAEIQNAISVGACFSNG